MILFHGSHNKIVVPAYGKGEEKHDYWQSFYLTESIDIEHNGLDLTSGNLPGEHPAKLRLCGT